MFAEFINTYGAEIIQAILVAIFGLLGMAAKRLASKYIDNGTKQSLAKSVVLFVEQVFTDLHGQDKLDKAMARLSDLLLDKGIDFTQQEIETLIEAAVAEFNEAFKKPALGQTEATEGTTEDTEKGTFEVSGFAKMNE